MSVSQVQEAVAGAGLDAFVVTDPDNIRYLTGARTMSAALWIEPGAAYLLTSFVELEDAQAHAHDVEVVRVFRRSEDLRPVTGASKARRVGFEPHHLTVRRLESFRRQAPRAEFEPMPDVIGALRAIKRPDEIERIRAACDIADRAMARATERLVAGVTERALALDMDSFMLHDGADDIEFLLIQFGPRSSLPHGEPTHRRLADGDLVLIDIGPEVDGYNADLTRTLVFGHADERQRAVYDVVRRAQQAGLEAIALGARGEDVDTVARNVIVEAGYGDDFGHSLGHGIAIGPLLAQGSSDVLTAGNVVTVEPGIYIPGWGGVRIEDTVLVTEQQPEILTRFPKDLEVIAAV